MSALDVPGAFNFRDVGGLPARGGETRAGVLFRSGNLAHLTDDGRAAVAALGIRRVVDLRDDGERRWEPSLLGDLPFDVVHLPMFAGSVASFFDDDLSLADLYRAIVDGSASRLVEVVRAVVTAQPVLVHCTVGKDRTGVSVALALAAAGVDEDAVIADYARTEALLPVARNERILGFLRGTYPHARHLEDLATRSPASAMRGVFDDLRARYGGPVDYLRAHGLGDDEVAALRRVLVG
ncbi:tyrosine-protein phosphatase [Microbacterium sp. EYE_5]|uniref:tyrosine-protein phosphatase n=1 Tax=unclassified Microbacterium TaxID=2609290 RepID=UPI0020069D20|nr:MULTISPECIES: tyrosine-protein phosphatase [unclassified Microbacterium]MCK6081437.1 tyrosine-protein phosphatase [Microbacterium sp. EYE_382]MCK6086707.1 tyrosine-protein phosphatase [Microbacterium sp. EYE_384]MCK6123795.1 tyrosine-protein phosphatase [Microbacterium sp. EYE_80]MCK6126704.1 tyrosine-protein phosphatase [Microbacterium sp. EYE_79]MCK6142392.1 tyrosine-protein phosphatase [Microbacterium sp. EYE_39]